MPSALYVEVFGKYIPRACVDVVMYYPLRGVIMQMRDTLPLLWNLPGGTIRRGETIFDAARRHVLHDVGAKIEPLEILGTLEILDEPMECDGVPVRLHNIMTVVKANLLEPPKLSDSIRWFKTAPHGACNPEHIKLLQGKGFIE
jgi:ADP-ribose pyrophosphatase YjhB (NUDIX family)